VPDGRERRPWQSVLAPVAAAAVFSVGIAFFFRETWRSGPSTSVPVQALFTKQSSRSAHDHVWEAITRSDSTFAAWLVGRNAYTLLHRPLDLFDTEHCAPAEQTMTLGEPMITMGLLGMPFYLATGDPILTYNLVLCLQWLIGAMAMYALVVAWTGVPVAGIVAGMMYVFHPVHTRDITHPFLHDTAWTVLALLFAQRLFAWGRWRDAVGLGLATALQLGSSFYPFLAAVFLTPPFVVWLIVRYRFRHVRPAQLALVAVLVALAAVSIFGPYLRAAGSQQRSYHFYAEWASFLPGGSRFAGWPAVMLILAGLVLGRRRALGRLDGDPRWMLALGGAIVGVTAMGGHGVSVLSALRGDPPLPIQLPNLYTMAAAVLPGLGMVRNAGQLALGTHLVLSILTGFGTAALLRVVGRRWALVLATILVLVVGLDTIRPAGLGFHGGIRWNVVRIRPPDEIVDFYAELARQGNHGPMVEVPIISNPMYVFGQALQRILYSAWHHRRTSACFASYKPPERIAVASLSEKLPAVAAVAELRRMGFTTIVVHQLPGAALRRGLDATAQEHPALLRRLHSSRWRTAYAIGTGGD
jgi:hypothetical protein